jgi:hypothetical protein
VRRFDLEHHALLAGESSADKARRRHLDLGDRITARDADDADIICEERRFLRRRQGRNDRPRRDDEIGIDHEENAQESLRSGVDDLDEVDPRERILLAKSREPVSAGHSEFTKGDEGNEGVCVSSATEAHSALSLCFLRYLL